jgi:tetratricopeptide (TPR) repeat protein
MMLAADLITTLRGALPAEESSNLIAALRQDPLVWQSLHDDSFLAKVLKKAESDSGIWCPAELAVLSMGVELSVSKLRSKREQIKDTALSLLATTKFEETIESRTIPSTLSQAGLIALGMREKTIATDSLLQVIERILPVSTGEYTNTFQVWRTSLACLFGMLSDPQELLQSLLPKQGSKIRIEWISHIILSDPAEYDTQIGTIYELMNQVSLGIQVGWLIDLNRIGKRKIVVALAKRILEDRKGSEGNGVKLTDTAIFKGDHYASKVMETQYLAELEQLAENSDEARLLLDSASEGLKSWIRDLDQQKEWINPETSSENVYPSQTLDEENPVAQIMKTGALKEESQKRIEIVKAAANRLVTLIHEDPDSIFPRYALGWQPIEIIKKLSDLALYKEAFFCAEAFITLRPADTGLISSACELAGKMGDPKKAVEFAGLLVLFDPENIKWRRNLAEKYQAAGDFDHALEERQKLLTLNDLPDIKDWLALADTSIQAGNMEKAFDACNAILAAEPENDLALAYLGKALLETGDLDEAIGTLSKATRIEPGRAKPWLWLAESLDKKGENEKALDTLRSAVIAAPNSVETNFAIAKACMDSGNQSEALPYLRKAARLSPDSLPVVIGLVETLEKLGHGLDAKTVVDSAREQWPGDHDLAYLQGKILAECGEVDEALQAFEIALSVVPERPDWFIDYAEIAFGEEGGYILGQKQPPSIEKIDQIINALEKQTGEDEPDFRAKILLAEAYIAKGEPQKALESYQETINDPAAKKEDWSWRNRAGLARAALTLDKSDMALTALREASVLKPDSDLILRNLAEAYASAHLIPDSNAVAKQVIHLRPEDPDTLRWFADLMCKNGNFNEAINALSTAKNLAPENCDLLLRIADIEFTKGDPEKSRTELNTILDLGCSNSDELEQGARIALKLEDTNLAQTFLEREIALDPKHTIEMRPVLAGIYRILGNPQPGLDHIQRTIQEKPDDPALYVFQADLLNDLGKAEAALASLEHVKAIMDSEGNSRIWEDEKDEELLPAAWKNALSSSAISKRFMEYYRNCGDYPSAITHADTAVETDPQNLDLRFQTILLTFSALSDDKVLEFTKDEALGSNKEKNQQLPLADLNGIYASLISTRANLLMDKDQLQDARRIIEKAVDQLPTAQVIKHAQARCLKLSGHYGEALEVFEQALSKDVDHPDSITTKQLRLDPTWELDGYWKAITALSLGQWERANRYFLEYQERFPKSPRSHLGRVIFIVTAAENQKFFEQIGSTVHAPGKKFLEHAAFDEFERELVLCSRNTNPACAKRWETRGKAVYTPDLTIVKALAMLPKNSDDASAFVCVLKDLKNVNAMLQVAQKFPDDPKVLANLALNLMETNPESSYKAAERAHDLDPENPIYSALASRCAEICADLPKAIKFIGIALQNWSEETEWQIRAAKMNEANGDIEEAINHWEQVTVLQPGKIEPLIELGKNYLANEESQKTIEILESGRKNNPNSVELYLVLARAYEISGNLVEALDNAAYAGQLDNKSSAPLLLCGEIALNMGDMQRAQEFANSALARNPENVKVILFASKIASRRKGPIASLDVIDHAIANGNNSVPVMLEKAAILQKLGKKNEAFESLQALASRVPDNAEVMSALAESQLALGKNLDAVDSAHRALKIDPDISDMHLLIGLYQGKNGQLDLAVDHLSEALRIDTSNVEAYLALANILKERRDFAGARKTYEEAINYCPDQAMPFYQLAMMLKESKDYSGTESLLRKAAALAPDDVNIKRQLGAVIALNLVHNAQEVTRSQ